MPDYRKIINRIWQFFRGGSTQQPLQGYRQTTLYRGSQLRTFDLPETPVRPTYGDLSLSYELLEMYYWCYEYRHAIDAIAADCFQQVDGEVGSWYVPEELSDGTKVNPEILLIAKELATGRNGKNLILGGDFLVRAAIEALAFGDSFVELGINKIGGKWDIVSSQYLPTFSMFLDQDQQSETLSCVQRTRLTPSGDDVEFAPLKILHFKYKSRGLYGNALGFPSTEPWRKFKDASIALETAARDVGIVPWLHIMPEGKTVDYKNDYMQRHESMTSSGILPNLYLMNGADVRKAANESGNSLKPLMDYWLQLRFQCIPPRTPVWMFPGLSNTDGGAKDLNGQPALTYARFVAEIRSMIGEQVRWAICVKYALRFGKWDNPPFDVKWPHWVLTPLSNYAQEIKRDDQDSK